MKHSPKTSSQCFNVDVIAALHDVAWVFCVTLPDNELCTTEFAGPFMTVVPCNLSCCHEEESSNHDIGTGWHRKVNAGILDSSTCSATIWFKNCSKNLCESVKDKGLRKRESGKRRKAAKIGKANKLNSEADPC